MEGEAVDHEMPLILMQRKSITEKNQTFKNGAQNSKFKYFLK